MYNPLEIDRRIRACGDDVRKLAKVFYQAKEQMHAQFPDECEPPTIDNALSCAECYVEGARRMGWINAGA